MSRAEQSERLDLDRIVFIGRTFEEYMRIFSLTRAEMMGKKILDCPAGACAFTGIANQIGLNVTACDIAYYHHARDLREKGLADIKRVMEHVETDKTSYVWEYFKDIEALRKERLSALHHCTEDRIKFPHRYVAVNLPTLPFGEKEFDIVLSAHFLFMYADRLDYDFHISTINELLRVAKEEVRIFPLVDLTGKRYEHLDAIIKYLEDKGYAVEEVKASYEFQHHANSMLKVKRVTELPFKSRG